MTKTILRAHYRNRLGGAVACSTAKADVEKVPVGTDVQVTSQDGGVVQGTLTEKDAKTVKVVTGKSGKTTKVVPREEIADVRVVEPSKPVELPAIAKFREYTIPDGHAAEARRWSQRSAARPARSKTRSTPGWQMP